MTTQFKKILIAEDDEPLANALKLKFKKAEIESVVVFNGKAVFDEIKKNDFDLILLNLIMPEMDGFAVLEKLEKIKNEIPVVIASNLGQEEDIRRSMALGAKDYIIKSNTPIVEIVNKIKKIIF